MEATILLWIQENLRADWLTPVVKGITYLGEAGWFWIALTILLLCLPKTRKIGLCMAVALIFDLLSVNLFIKNLFMRTRPYEMIDGLTRLVGEQSDFSFPSGHTAASFAASVVLLLRAPKKLSVPMFILAILISLSRLYVGVHYPTDILGGALIGSLCAFAAVFVVGRSLKRIKTKSEKA